MSRGYWRTFFGQLALLMLLSGCSQTSEIHLYGRYLSEAQTNQLRQALTHEGFKVTVNQLAFPTTISQPTLIYGMPMDRPDEVAQVRQLVQTQGWQLQDAQSLVKGNHWYSGNSMGLFLLPDGVNPNQLSSVHDLSFVYHSQGCDAPANISLTADHRFQIQPVNGATTEAALLQGRWQVRQLPYVELIPDGNSQWAYYLELSRQHSQDQLGAVQQILLTPLQTYPIFGRCSFVHGVRQQ